jgi:Na+/H+ antiporter NhaD/arsenite permease-like protein
MGIKAIPYLLAVATASNIGSTATITGNPQNILIASFSGIGYRDFLWHLGPVALVGLFLEWFALWWLYFRGQIRDVRIEPVANAVRIEHAALLKARIVAALVLAGFLAGFSPAMVASVGAAVLLSGRAMARIGLRMMPPFPSPSLKVGHVLADGGSARPGETSCSKSTPSNTHSEEAMKATLGATR